MAHLWKRDVDGSWAVVPLAHSYYTLAQEVSAVPRHEALPAACAAARLVRVSGPERRPPWALLAPPSARITVNDQPLILGLRLLRDKDKLISGSRWCYYFSTEELARPEAFPGLPRPITCPRCVRTLEPGDRAVCCPGCGTWHHSTDDYPCWTFAPTCSNCDQRTDATDTFAWSPALL